MLMKVFFETLGRPWSAKQRIPSRAQGRGAQGLLQPFESQATDCPVVRVMFLITFSFD